MDKFILRLLYLPIGLVAGITGGILDAIMMRVVDRGAAEATLRLTGIWPGDTGEE